MLRVEVFEGHMLITADHPICDFCSSPDIVVAYFVSRFVLPQWQWGSADDTFAACETCMKLIETGQRSALEKRSLDTLIARHGRILPDELTRRFIHELHVEIWKRFGTRSQLD